MGWQMQFKPDKPWKGETDKKAPKYRSPLGDYDAMLPTHPQIEPFGATWKPLSFAASKSMVFRTWSNRRIFQGDRWMLQWHSHYRATRRGDGANQRQS
jgi:hypothetical protein